MGGALPGQVDMGYMTKQADSRVHSHMPLNTALRRQRQAGPRS